MILLPQTQKAIDSFQRDVACITASKIASEIKVPLISSADLTRLSYPKHNLLTVALGPFHICIDERFTMWQPFWVSVIEKGKPFGDLVAGALTVLNNKGFVGYYQVRLWDIYKQRFNYYGYENQFISSEAVATVIIEHLASQYHVGFVEDENKNAKNNAMDNYVLQVENKVRSNAEEVQRQIEAEKQATKR